MRMKHDSRCLQGDLGIEGIQRFFETHTCSKVCHYFKFPKRSSNKGALPPVAWKPLEMVPELGMLRNRDRSGLPSLETCVEATRQWYQHHRCS